LSANIRAMIDNVATVIAENTPRYLAIAAQFAIMMISMRVTEGRDLRGNAFIPHSTRSRNIGSDYVSKSGYYTGGYAEYKRTLGQADQFLRLSGQMMNDLVLREVSDTCVAVLFATAESAKKATENNRTRWFLGLTEDEVDRIIAHVVELMLSELSSLIVPINEQLEMEL